MALRFRKSIKIMPGVRLNLSKSGVSTTLGGRGASVNVGKRGVYANAGLSGTGLSMRQRLDTPKTKARAAAPPPAPDAWVDDAPAPRSPQDLARLGGGQDEPDHPRPERSSWTTLLRGADGRRGRLGFVVALLMSGGLVALSIALTPREAYVPGSGIGIGVSPTLLLLGALAVAVYACWQRIRDIGLPGSIGAAVIVALAVWLPMGLLAVLAGLLLWPGQAQAVTPGIRPGLKFDLR